jgi:hypothetical protein
VWKSAIILSLLVVPSCICKWSINPFANSNPVYSHTPKIRDNIHFEVFTGCCDTVQICGRICTFHGNMLSSILNLKMEVACSSERSGCTPTKLHGVTAHKILVLVSGIKSDRLILQLFSNFYIGTTDRSIFTLYRLSGLEQQSVRKGQPHFTIGFQLQVTKADLMT